QNGGRASAPSFAPKPCRRDSQIAGMISVMPVSRPGMRPAANSAGTEAPGTSTEYTMNAMDGGMRMSIAAAAPMTLAEKGAGYPARCMATSMTPPTAAAVAGPDPEMPPIIIATRMAIIGSMPGPRPKMDEAKVTSRSATPG